ncbi:hypothetical protein Pan54_16270 [Rubinisphaera italica]|uniref:Uncharacterized protein n=1 Tax=Rubinisphaera italica TaxID=2527969 RepID=A0A5C5XFG8_9PLAN|nr:hypothetical protein Pan54_16270 [Rubinisphaera italica]
MDSVEKLIKKIVLIMYAVFIASLAMMIFACVFLAVISTFFSFSGIGTFSLLVSIFPGVYMFLKVMRQSKYDNQFEQIKYETEHAEDI